MSEGPLDKQPQSGRLRGKEQARTIGYEKVKESGNCTSKAGLFRSLAFPCYQMLGLLKQVVMERQDRLLSSDLDVRPAVAFTVDYRAHLFSGAL